MTDIQISCGETVLFENADWRVIENGLEHRETEYFIARESLARRSETGAWEWPLHLAEKRWCSPRLFREAFLAAADLFDVAVDDGLAQSFATGFGLRMGQAGASAADDFTKLSELVRPRSLARRRPASSETRSAPQRSGLGRADEADAARTVSW